MGAVQDTLSDSRVSNDELPQQVADKITPEMRRLTPAQREELLRLIAALPIARLQLIDFALPLSHRYGRCHCVNYG